MRKLEFGWVVPIGARSADGRATYQADVRRSLDLIARQFASVWTVDHFQYDTQDVLEGWTTLSYLAALYPSFDFGTMVLGQSYRNPALTAKMAATLHYLTNERLIFGIGAGWKEDEYHAYGYDFPRPSVRIDQLDEAIRIIKALWTEPTATFHGRYYRISDAICEPKPHKQPLMVIGSKKPRMLHLTARHADWWNYSWSGTPTDRFRQALDQLRQACDSIGRDPDSVRKTWFGPCSCALDEQAALRATEGKFSSAHGFVGTPTQIIAQMRPYIELGVDYFMLSCADFPATNTIELFCEYVIPALREEFKP